MIRVRVNTELKQESTRDEEFTSMPTCSTASSTREATRHYLQISLEFLRSMPPSADTAKCLLDLAWMSIGEGCEAEAEALLRESSFVVGNIPALLPDYLRTAGAFALRQDDLPLARRTFTMIQMIPDTDSSTMAYSWEGLAIVAALTGEEKTSLSLASRAAARRVETKMEVSPWWQRQFETAMAEVRKVSSTESRSTVAKGSSTSVSVSGGQAMDGCAGVDDAPARRTKKRAQKAEPTLRERVVAELVAHGMSNRQIARNLKLSERTVESHLANLRTKLHLQSRAQVAIWAARRAACVCKWVNS